MASELGTALKSAKEVDRQLTVAENRFAYVQEEIKRATENKEKLNSEITVKKAEYDMYIAGKDAEWKKVRQDVLDERAQLDKDKVEFQGILQKFKLEQNALASDRETFENDKRKTGAQVENIKQFVMAVQRACSLLGL
jgi:chromosome segregation ATPase